MKTKDSELCAKFIQRVRRRNYPPLVSVFAPDLENPYFGGLTKSFVRRFNREGVHVSVSDMFDRNIEIVKMFAPSATIMVSQVDWAFISKVATEDNIIGVNCVFPEGFVFPNVELDFREAYSKLIGQAIDRGHRKFAFVTHVRQDLKNSKLRQAREILSANGVSPVSSGKAGVFKDVGTFVEFHRKHRKAVDVVICEDDPTAGRLVAELALSGVRVPGEVIVIGCDNTVPVSALWTIDIDLDKVAGIVLKLYKHLLSKGIVTRKTVIRPRAIVRGL